jgi:hypothetical protein
MTVAQLEAILAKVENKDLEVVTHDCLGGYTPALEVWLHDLTYLGDRKYTNAAAAAGEKERVLIIE